MKRRKFSSVVAAVLIFALIFSLFSPGTKAAAAGAIDQAAALENGKEQTGAMKEPEQVKWYKVTPGATDIQKNSHRRRARKKTPCRNGKCSRHCRAERSDQAVK